MVHRNQIKKAQAHTYMQFNAPSSGYRKPSGKLKDNGDVSSHVKNAADRI